jgi:hypothetical protein
MAAEAVLRSARQEVIATATTRRRRLLGQWISYRILSLWIFFFLARVTELTPRLKSNGGVMTRSSS